MTADTECTETTCPHHGQANAAALRARNPRFGERVRVSCGATGRYLGLYGDKKLALFVSAMDNSLCVDVFDPVGDPPHLTLPVPTDGELEAACDGVRFGLRMRI